MGLFLLTLPPALAVGVCPAETQPQHWEEVLDLNHIPRTFSPPALNYLEQSWPRICWEITPGAGEAENPISAGLVGAVRGSCSSGVSLSQLWDTGLAQQPWEQAREAVAPSNEWMQDKNLLSSP